jgi:EAL domain-containing protein (putative c-di-GMP-specific phosphodiesterase class I)
MALLDGPTPIETDDHVLRARRTAALTRIVTALAGVVLVLTRPALLPHQWIGVLGFAIIGGSAVVQMAAPGMLWLRIEESLSPAAGLLIIGFGHERVTVLTILWLVALASGVLARGGRVHWLGRNIVLCALALPVVRYGSLSAEYAGMLVASLGLLLTSGRLTSELNHLLRQARLQAESAETLLLAGDIAARVAERDERAGHERAPARLLGDRGAGPSESMAPSHSPEDRRTLIALLRGEGISMAAQPIVDIRTGAVHGHEALARFNAPGSEAGPMHWFKLADELGERVALERACLRKALDLFPKRPPGTVLSLNLSAQALLDPMTTVILRKRHGDIPRDLTGLIIEITEETLVHAEVELESVIAPLRARGAVLAVDDMGAGYSGLRQITNVRPSYLKLDRSLISGIDSDHERGALVGALAGYARKVGSLLVAEGVETEAELAVVLSLGVPLVQGFYFSRPAEPWPELNAHSGASVSRPVIGDDEEDAPEQLDVLMPAA